MEFRPSDIPILDKVATLLEKEKMWRECVPLLEKLFKLTNGNDLDRSCQFLLRRVNANVEMVRVAVFCLKGRESTKLPKSGSPTSTAMLAPKSNSWTLPSVLTICCRVTTAMWIELSPSSPKS